MAFIAENAVQRKQQAKRCIQKEGNILRGMIVIDLLRQYSEEHQKNIDSCLDVNQGVSGGYSDGFSEVHQSSV
jgi:hypothetical protein